MDKQPDTTPRWVSWAALGELALFVWLGSTVGWGLAGLTLFAFLIALGVWSERQQA